MERVNKTIISSGGEIMNVKNKFIEDVVKELNDVNRERIKENKNPLDIPFMVSVLDQQLETCEEFIHDISKNKYLINGFEEVEGIIGRMQVLIEKPEDEKESNFLIHAFYDYCYYIDFFAEPRLYGECKCSPDDEGYNHEYGCCGLECEWYAPSFEIYKSIFLKKATWKGDQRDYLEYEKQFKENEKRKNNEVEEYKKQQRKKFLQQQIEQLQKELDSL